MTTTIILLVCCAALAILWVREHLENKRLRQHIERTRPWPPRKVTFRLVKSYGDHKP